MVQLDKNGLSEEQFLEQYSPGDYVRPSVTVDNVIFAVADTHEENYRKLPKKELRILLIQRGMHPFIGQWALPGGFVRPNETVGEAAERELEEEAGISGGYLEQLYTFSKPGRDPRTWVISCAHMALVDGEQILPKAGSDADRALWFTLRADDYSDTILLSLSNDEVSLRAVVDSASGGRDLRIVENNGLAFDHAEIIAYAVRRLRAKLEYTDLAFSLMPERFTLTELQQVYEAILGRPLFKAAFRRKIRAMVEETDEYTQNAGHRPSQMFMRKNEEDE